MTALKSRLPLTADAAFVGEPVDVLVGTESPVPAVVDPAPPCFAALFHLSTTNCTTSVPYFPK